jgi:hypothetical protein
MVGLGDTFVTIASFTGVKSALANGVPIGDGLFGSP